MFRFITFLFVVTLSIGLTGCIFDFPGSSRGGDIEVEERSVDDFSALKLSGNFEVQLENADTFSLKISANQALMDMIITEVQNGVLVVRGIEDTNWNKYDAVKLVVSVPTLDLIEIRASASFISDNPFSFDSLRIESGGALNMDMELNGNFLQGELEGATNLKLKGKTNEVRLKIPGAAKISAYELLTDKLHLDLSGAGTAKVYVSDQLNVDLAGACSVTYKGNPNKVFSNVSGIGRIREAK